MKKVLLLASMVMLVVSCGGDKKQTEETTAQTETTPTPAVEETPSDVVLAQDGKEVSIDLSGTDQMTYDKKEIHVKAGQKIKLTLHHSGQSPKTAMGHNFVLLKQGTNIADFANQAMQAKDNDYIPKDSKDIIAHTKLIGGGESDTIEFDAPEKGTYDYICTFPGHYAQMKGKLIVE